MYMFAIIILKATNKITFLIKEKKITLVATCYDNCNNHS